MFCFSLYIGHSARLRRQRPVPRVNYDGGPRNAQLLLLLRRVRSGPGGAETSWSDKGRLWTVGHYDGRCRGRHASVDSYIPGGRGQVQNTVERWAAHPWLDCVFNACLPGRGNGRPVQWSGTHTRPVYTLIGCVVSSVRVYQKVDRQNITSTKLVLLRLLQRGFPKFPT